MIDKSARTLLHILRSTSYLVDYYHEKEDGPMMCQLKIAFGPAISELEAAGADQPDPEVPFAESSSWHPRESSQSRTCRTKSERQLTLVSN